MIGHGTCPFSWPDFSDQNNSENSPVIIKQWHLFTAAIPILASSAPADPRPRRWTPKGCRPGRVTVSPPEGDRVSITVRRDGPSSVGVAAPGAVKTLYIRPVRQGAAMMVAITQEDGPAREAQPEIA